jgi:glutaconate CoA-transferase subunit B
MILRALHPGVAIDAVRERVGWDLRVSDTVEETEHPTDEEIRIIREDLDPGGIYIK